MTENLATYPTVNPAVVDAFVKANRAVARGFEQLTKHYIETTRQSLEEGVQVQRRFAGASSIGDIAALQGQLAQDVWQTVWSRGREWSDLSTSIARDVMGCFSPPGTEVDSTSKAPRRAA